LVSVPVEGLNLVRPLGIIYRRGVELGKTARRFIQLLQETSESPSKLDVYDSENGVDADEPLAAARIGEQPLEAELQLR
jgi:hypothetical protein